MKQTLSAKSGRRLAAALSVAACCTAPAHAAAATSAPFVDAATLVPGLVVDLRYAGSNNVTGRPLAGYEAPRCLLTRPAAAALARAQADLRGAGLGLKVFDCYRPARAVADLLAWARSGAGAAGGRDLVALGYVARRSAHSRGAAVDVTLVEVASGRELAMGTPFDAFGPEAARAITATARANRARLRRAMEAHGLQALRAEWWHFALRAEPARARSHDLPVRGRGDAASRPDHVHTVGGCIRPRPVLGVDLRRVKARCCRGAALHAWRRSHFHSAGKLDEAGKPPLPEQPRPAPRPSAARAFASH